MTKIEIIISNYPVWQAITTYRLLGTSDPAYYRGEIYGALSRRNRIRHAKWTAESKAAIVRELEKDMRAYGRHERTLPEIYSHLLSTGELK